MERKETMATASKEGAWRSVMLYVGIAVIMGAIAAVAAVITLQSIGLVSIP